MIAKDIFLKFMSGLTEVNARLFTSVLDIVSKIPTDKDGNIVNNRKTRALLDMIKEEVQKVLNESGFFVLTDELFESFDTLIEGVQDIHKEINGISVPRSLLTPQKRLFTEQLKARLLDAGIRSEFSLPLEQALFSYVRNNARIIDLERNIRATVQDNLKRWAGEAARDAVYGYQGAMHDTVKAEYDLNGFIYVGTIRENTRAQCKKWLNKAEKDAYWAKEIKWAKKGGTYNKQRARGFMPNTTLDNFSQNRGGFNCLHEAIPTNIN